MRATRAMAAMAGLTMLLSGAAGPLWAKQFPPDVLGLYPGMSDVDARRQLEKIGEVVRGKDVAKQTWKLRDRRYEYLVIRYDQDWKLHWATAFAREGGRRVRYCDIGDPSLAQHSGSHFYTWTIPARSGAGSWTVVARGSDPQYLASISIYPSPRRQDLIVPGHEEPDTSED